MSSNIASSCLPQSPAASKRVAPTRSFSSLEGMITRLKTDISSTNGLSPIANGNFLWFSMVGLLSEVTRSLLVLKRVRPGHGTGTEAVDFVKEKLPASIKTALSSELVGNDCLPDSVIAKVLQECITQVDEAIRVDVQNLFPGGEQEIAQLSDDKFKRTIQDPDEPTKSSVKIIRARTGTTALIALVDQVKAIHIANLCDCQACAYHYYLHFPLSQYRFLKGDL
ncbi:hypothetical protein V5O48_005535 [Marasmius crinis-equi]|uniref:Uncharacterized protein n=1 Tax=Marasmius crinis-equi TaxID=585013 RepID=A0ABR3FMB0_9AGAR